MRHGSLFSGIGGFDLAAEWVGWENVFQVENDKFCNKVLKKNFPNVKRYGDIKEFKGEPGQCDIISGGFPCQPFSQAGKRQGEADHRFLWFEMLRVITEIKPLWVVGENVTGLLSLENGKTFDRILTSLEAEGYEVESFIIPACGVGAWHRRDRIWIIAHTDRIRGGKYKTGNVGKIQKTIMGQSKDVSNTKSSGWRNRVEFKREVFTRQRQQNVRDLCKNVSDTKKTVCKQSGNTRTRGARFTDSDWWDVEPELGRVAHGIPNRVDRLKGLGNAIVPQVAFEIFKAIDNETKEKHST